MRKVCAGLLLVVVSCGPQATSWRPFRNGVSTDPIAKTAIQVEDSDMDTIVSAGGTTIGMLTYQSGEYSVATIIDYAGGDAAEKGGTHYMLGDWKEREGDSTYTAAPTFGGGYVVREHKNSSVTVRVTVIRVPRSGWRDLPDRMVPKAL